MNVKNCRKCGKIFNYIGGIPICPNCKEELEKKFEEVKEYVRNNPRSDIKTVSTECEVEMGQIQQWIREERLVFADDSPIGIPCEKCGAMIKSGRFCENCKNEMTRGFNDAFRKPTAPPPVQKKEPAGSKMRFLDR